jgi:hypothetical protein
MKKQIHNSHRVLIAITFVITLLTFAACKEKKVHDQDTSVSENNVTPPEIDMHTAIISDNVKAVQEHIAAGSDLNVKDPIGGSSPLISASLFGKTEMAKILIDAGADLNFQNNDGSTALHTASFFCRPEIVKMLLDKGVDKTIKNKYGQTAYETVSGNFIDVKNTYDALGKMLEPMGLKMDYTYIEKTRPEIAAILK